MEHGYSICFNQWALDKTIKSELGLLLIISSLTAEKGYCFASNAYFANLFDIDEVSVSRKLSKLQSKNYITIEYEKRGAEIVSRKIRLTKMLSDGLQKSQSTVNKNVKDNITSINITSNKNKKDFELPIYIAKERWEEWVKFRKQLKKPLTDLSIQKQIKFLGECQAKGQNPNSIIEQSIQNGWTGLFELKKNTSLLDRCINENSRSYEITDENNPF